MILPLVVSFILCRGVTEGTSLVEAFQREVSVRLDVPAAEGGRYADDLFVKLPNLDRPQYVVLVDRSPLVQAAMIFWLGPDRPFHFIGASPASTGKPGRFDHFVTPIGVYEHTVDNPDFRALGMKRIGHSRLWARWYASLRLRMAEIDQGLGKGRRRDDAIADARHGSR